jgi:hypothetical protein
MVGQERPLPNARRSLAGAAKSVAVKIGPAIPGLRLGAVLAGGREALGSGFESVVLACPVSSGPAGVRR